MKKYNFLLMFLSSCLTCFLLLSTFFVVSHDAKPKENQHLKNLRDVSRFIWITNNFKYPENTVLVKRFSKETKDYGFKFTSSTNQQNKQAVFVNRNNDNSVIFCLYFEETIQCAKTKETKQTASTNFFVRK